MVKQFFLKYFSKYAMLPYNVSQNIKRFYYYYNYKGALGQFGPGLIPGNLILFIFRQN